MKTKGMLIGRHFSESFLLSISQNVPIPVHIANIGTMSQVSDMKNCGKESLCLRFSKKSPLLADVDKVPSTWASLKASMKI